MTYGYGDPMDNKLHRSFAVGQCLYTFRNCCLSMSTASVGQVVPSRCPTIRSITYLIQTSLLCVMCSVTYVGRHILLLSCVLYYDPTTVVPTSIADLQMLFPSALVTHGIQISTKGSAVVGHKMVWVTTSWIYIQLSGCAGSH